MPAALMNKEEVLARLSDTFRRWGYDGTTLSRLCEATGLVRASLYHYFPKGKKQMAEAVLAEISQSFHNEVVEPLLRRPADPDSLDAFAEDLIRFYRGGSVSCLMEVFTLGSAKPLFGKAIGEKFQGLRRVLTDVLEQMKQSPEQAARRARIGVAMVQGALVLARGEEDHTLFTQTMRELPAVLRGTDV